jgi:hypothetical protein
MARHPRIDPDTVSGALNELERERVEIVRKIAEIQNALRREKATLTLVTPRRIYKSFTDKVFRSSPLTVTACVEENARETGACNQGSLPTIQNKRGKPL